MKRLLMLSYPFPPNASAGAVRSERFARYLPQHGWDVEVVTIQARRDMFADTARLNALGGRVKVHFTKVVDPWLWLRDIRPVNIILRALRSALMKVLSFPDHMLFWVPFAVAKGFDICSQKPVTAIYTTSPPHSAHLAGLLLSRLTGKPWVADFRDPWTLNAYHDKGALGRFLLKIERYLEKGVLKSAALILANTKANRTKLIRAFSFLSQEQVVYLPNGWEEFPRTWLPNKKTNFPLTIVHAGTFYPRFKPYGLLYALAHWRDKVPDGEMPKWLDNSIRVLLLGARDEETRNVVQRLGIQDLVEFRPWVALEEARKIMVQADLLWASLGTHKESSTYVPSKLFEYIAARRPIIGFFPEGEAASLIIETRAGKVFTSDAPVPIIRFLAQCIDENKNGNGCTYNPDLGPVNAIRVDGLIAEFHRILSRVC
jgi:glycosyltransferase involved in cell wall biosynthesis